MFKVTHIFSFKAKVRTHFSPCLAQCFSYRTSLPLHVIHFVIFLKKWCWDKFQRQMHLQLHSDCSCCHCHPRSLSQCLNPITGDNLNGLKLPESVSVATDPPHSKDAIVIGKVGHCHFKLVVYLESWGMEVLSGGRDDESHGREQM